MSDASPEAARITEALRSAGYDVEEVPLASVASRASARRPHVVLVDGDAGGALEEVGRLRQKPGSAAIDVIYLGAGAGAVSTADDALANHGSAFFLRPVDVAGLVRKVEALTGGPAAPPLRPSTPPSIPPPSREMRDSSLPPPSMRFPGPPLPMSTPSLAELVDAPRSLASFGAVSQELAQLLADAERKAEVSSQGDAALPTPDEEIEAVLPADVLASLDEPLDGEEDEDMGFEGGARLSNETSPGRDGAHTKGTTGGGSQRVTTGSGHKTGTSSETQERKLESDAPVLASVSGTTPAVTRSRRPPPGPGSDHPRSAHVPESAVPTRVPSSWVPPPLASVPPASGELRGASVRPPPAAKGGVDGVVLGVADARSYLADAIARRATGALCFENDGVVRRIVLRDGDLVTAASGADAESLVAFLGARGELPRDEVARLAARVPPYGRHAGAALVAHGWLRQDQLWGVLRAHSEWLASIVLTLPAGVASLEVEPPGRLRSEPSVFGAATGPEIFVDLVRRVVSPDEAILRLGGTASRIAEGPNHGVIVECNLSHQELEMVSRGRGSAIADVLARAPDAEVACMLHALALLGVIEIVPAPELTPLLDMADVEPDVLALDEDAVRARVRARLELVDEGDYFTVLGVARDATSYEVRRAFLELRRAFEPSHLLTPRTADLAEDVRKIVLVLEEAYDILRDGARRERYRRAIDARPGG